MRLGIEGELDDWRRIVGYSCSDLVKMLELGCSRKKVEVAVSIWL